MTMSLDEGDSVASLSKVCMMGTQLLLSLVVVSVENHVINNHDCQNDMNFVDSRILLRKPSLCWLALITSSVAYCHPQSEVGIPAEGICFCSYSASLL